MTTPITSSSGDTLARLSADFYGTVEDTDLNGISDRAVTRFTAENGREFEAETLAGPREQGGEDWGGPGTTFVFREMSGGQAEVLGTYVLDDQGVPQPQIVTDNAGVKFLSPALQRSAQGGAENQFEFPDGSTARLGRHDVGLLNGASMKLIKAGAHHTAGTRSVEFSSEGVRSTPREAFPMARFHFESGANASKTVVFDPEQSEDLGAASARVSQETTPKPPPAPAPMHDENEWVSASTRRAATDALDSFGDWLERWINPASSGDTR